MYFNGVKDFVKLNGNAGAHKSWVPFHQGE